ncbi:MAG: YicC family protein [Bacteroidales bacterium]|nr:YicC family protein [Bacteroidales bacterium]
MKSMTGYGKCSVNFENKVISVEIRTLNSKQADINIKVPQIYKSKEIEINNILKTKLERGKIDCYITVQYAKDSAVLEMNKELFVSYYKQLKEVLDGVSADVNSVIEYLLQRDDVMQSNNNELGEEESQILLSCVASAVEMVDEYRKNEAIALKDDLVKRVNIIRDLSNGVEDFEKQRVPIIKEKLLNRLNQLQLENVDMGRLEQELIYYLEKLDITEEKVRLNKHIDYFLETVEQTESQGKKLGFIAQEMGREINTLGSKSNDAQMQRIVVKMKDELEKIKEQLANIL